MNVIREPKWQRGRSQCCLGNLERAKSVHVNERNEQRQVLVQVRKGAIGEVSETFLSKDVSLG